MTLLGLAGYGHVGYPLAVALAGRRRVAPTRPAPAEWPSLSVVVPAYRESQVIADKVRNLLENGYRGALEVVVVPEDEDTEAAVTGTGAIVVPFTVRTGKAGALNRGLRASSHSIVVFTDANARLSPGTLSALVAWLDDLSFGAAGARKLVDGEGVYWKFEDWLKRSEMKLGSSIALDGAVMAFRREELRPLPDDVVVDDLWLALDVAEAGRAIAYDPDFVCEEGGFPTLASDWERRTRIVAGALDVLWRRKAELRPGASASFQLWGHRLVRSSVGPTSHLTLLCLAAANVRRSRAARLFLVGHVGLAAAAAGGRLRREPTRLERSAYQVAYLQAVGVGGTLRFLRGDLSVRWKKNERGDEFDRS